MTGDPQGALTLAFTQPVPSSRRSFTIGQLAREFGLTLRALRFYEDRGLISPTRDGTARVYSPRDRARLSLIVRAKALGFTLAEIKETLLAEEPIEEPKSLPLSPAQIADQIAHLEQQKLEIDAALGELHALRARLSDARAA